MLLERAVLFSHYDTRKEEGSESRRYQVIPTETTRTISRCFNSGVFLEYQPPVGLDFGLLPDRVLGEELIGGRECRVAIDIRVRLE